MEFFIFKVIVLLVAPAFYRFFILFWFGGWDFVLNNGGGGGNIHGLNPYKYRLTKPPRPEPANLQKLLYVPPNRTLDLQRRRTNRYNNFG